MRRLIPTAVLALVLTVGQVGALLHGLFHAAEFGGDVAAHVYDGDGHDEHSGEKSCAAFDGMIGAAACGSMPSMLVAQQVAATGAQYYFRYPIVRVVFSPRAPPSFRA